MKLPTTKILPNLQKRGLDKGGRLDNVEYGNKSVKVFMPHSVFE